MDDVFNIENFNIIQDSDNYYFFRALNMADNADIDGNITTDENGNITRIRTDRERWEETHTERAPRYDKEAELSLNQINDHIKMRYSKETNCISLSSNANVSIVYGRGSYTDKYVIVKVPKNEMGKNIVNAGQYMLEEVEKRINEAIEGLNKTENEELFNSINQIRNATTSDEIADAILNSQVLNTTSQMNYMGTKVKDRADALPARARLSNYQALNEEQTLEKNKIMGILTVLERKGVMEPIIPNTTTNSNLARTLGNAFSSSEVIHYGDIEKSEIIPVSKDIMDMFALLQQVKEKSPNEEQNIDEIERKLLEYANNGYEIQNKNGELVFTNGQDTINIDETSQKLLELQETELPNVSIDEMYELTQGKIDYKSAMQMQKMLLFYANKSRAKAIALSNIISEIAENNPQYVNVIQNIKTQTFSIEPKIITRQNERGYKLSESVNIGAKGEEIELIKDIQNLPIEEIIETIESKAQVIDSDIIRQRFSKIMYDKPIDKQTYYAKAIIDSYNWEKTGIGFRPEERQEFEKRLKNTDIINLYEKLTKLNLPEKTISQMILNIAINKNFSNILNMENFEEQIKEHSEELTQDLSIDQVETFLGYYDVPGTDIVLREYQQRAVNNANKKFEERQFASIILPTGAGKSFVAMTELLEHKNDRMLYLAPSNEILDQIRKYIIENIHGTKGTLNKTPDQIIKEVFPNLELATYQSLLHKKGDILKESKYDFMVLDELHRTGAEKWQKKLELLLESQEEQTKILGITATPERDADGRNMANELALKIGKKYNKAYTEEEVKVGKHIAMNMDLIEAIRLGIVVNPKIVSCEYNIIHGGTLEKLLQRINEIEDETKKTELMQKYENLRGKLSNAQGIPELLAQNIQKKNGRYIVFIPVSDDGEDLEDEYGNKSSKKNPEDKIKEAEMQLREWLQGVDETKYDEQGNIIDGPEIYSMLGQYSKNRNASELNEFETSDSEHTKIIIVMNKLNEGVHVKGIDGIIWTRALDENSKILLLQQLGRAIYGIDPQKPVKDEDRPLVIDLPNNLLNVDLQKTINTYTQKDDLELLNEMVEWVQAHNGYIPDINSNSREEARRAITLKRIQSKYEKYLQNPELYNDFDEEEQEEIEEIQNIIKKGSKIDLWEIEFPDRIGKDGKKVNESELENIEFYLEGTMRDLYELQEEIEEEEEKGSIEQFIEKMETLRNLGVKVDLLATTNTIEDLVNKTIKQSKKENKELDEETEKSRMIKDIEDNGLKLDDKIGSKLNTIRGVYRGTQSGTKPTPEQVKKIEEDLGISLEKIEKIDIIQEFIEKMETLAKLGVKVDLLKQSNKIEDLVKSTIEQSKKENKELDEEKVRSRMIKDIEDNGLKLDDTIGPKLDRIKARYRGTQKKGTKPIPEQVAKLKELGIILEEIDTNQEFIEKMETLDRLGVKVYLLKQRNKIEDLVESTIKQLKKENKELDEEKVRSRMIKDIEDNGLKLDDTIGPKLDRIKARYRGTQKKGTKPIPEQVAKLKELGIILEEIDTNQEFIEKMETLDRLGVKVYLLKQRNKIEDLVESTIKQLKKENKELDEEKVRSRMIKDIEDNGLKLDDTIGPKLDRIKARYRGTQKKGTKPIPEQVAKLKELGIILEEIDTNQEFIEKMETLDRLGVKVYLLKQRNKIEDLVESTIKQLKKENKELDEEKVRSRMIKDIEDNGLKLDDTIGPKLDRIRAVYRGTQDGTKPTPEQVDKLKNYGITLEKKSKSKKELAEAAFPAITDPDLLDSEQQALDTLISKTEEKGGKNGQKQQS